MSERSEMIRAAAASMPPFIQELREKIRLGQKSQTRRVIKPEWSRCLDLELEEDLAKAITQCPYGHAGEIRYFREPLIKGADGLAHFRDDGALCLDQFGGEFHWLWQRDTLPQIFMPKTLARTFVRYEAIRVERLQEISLDDCLAEGVHGMVLARAEAERDEIHEHALTQVPYQFKVLWEKINGKRGFGWDENDWVWVLSFGLIGGKQ